MEFVELENGTILEIRIDDEEKQILRDVREENADPNNPYADYLDSNHALYDFFENVIANCDYDWIRPEECGDLTDAPMLGYRGDERPVPSGVNSSDLYITGGDGGQTFYAPVEKRWAFMDYAVKSLLVELLEHGKVQLVGGSLTESESD